jgi:hypothetical protein
MVTTLRTDPEANDVVLNDAERAQKTNGQTNGRV